MTRGWVQISPRKPKVSGPWASSSGIRARCSGVRRRGAPGGLRWRKLSKPPSFARFTHRLTAPLVTPRASAMFFCLHPIWNNSRPGSADSRAITQEKMAVSGGVHSDARPRFRGMRRERGDKGGPGPVQVQEVTMTARCRAKPPTEDWRCNNFRLRWRTSTWRCWRRGTAGRSS